MSYMSDRSVSKKQRCLDPKQTVCQMEISIKQQEREPGSLRNIQNLCTPSCFNETDQQVHCMTAQ